MGFFGVITQPAQADYMQSYGNMNVATFLIIGFMIRRYLQTSQYGPQGISNPGILQRILLTPCSISVFVLGSMVWRYFMNTLDIVVYCFIGIIFFGMNLSSVDWFTFIIIILLGILAMWGLSIISSSIQLVTKQWNPVNWFFSTFSFLFSGLFFSPEALLTVDSTGILYRLAWCLPHTYIYHMVRLAFIGKSILDMLPNLINLIIMMVVFFGIGWITFKLCLRRCQLEGSLGWI